MDAGSTDVAKALDDYVKTLDTVISTDARGHSDLKPIALQYPAMFTLDSAATVGQYVTLLDEAANALTTRTKAWSGFSAAVDTLVGLLDQYAALDARAGRMTGSSEDADTAIVLAVTQDGGAAAGSLPAAGAGVDILDANALGLASQGLEAMDAADQA